MNASGHRAEPPSEQISLPADFADDLNKTLPRPVPGPWIVALSGGCDSTALCRLLAETAGSPGIPHPGLIAAVHVHHGLRGKEADRDEEFSCELARSLDFSFQSMRTTPPPGLKPGAREKWARQERYSILNKTALDLGANLVLTAHNRNDQAETVLIRFLRSAGYWGLAGIRPVRPLVTGSSVLLARPLLNTPRAALRTYLDGLSQPFQQDRTNEDPAYIRNRIRHRLIPLLQEKTSRDLTAELSLIAEKARAIHILLDKASEKVTNRFVTENTPPTEEEERLSMKCSDFLELHERLRFGLLRFLSHRLSPRQVPLSRQAFASLTQSLAGSSSASSWALGAGVTIRRDGELLVIQNGEAPAKTGPAAEPRILGETGVPGRLDLPDGFRFFASFSQNRIQAKSLLTLDSAYREVLDADAVRKACGGEIVLRFRTRRRGDTFHPLGAPGRKKLKSFLIDLKVPAVQRETIPLLCCGSEIAWVFGHRISETFRVTDETKRFLVLSVGHNT